MKLLLALLLFAAPPLQDAEAKKARIGEILKVLMEVDKEVAGDRKKEEEAANKYLPQIQEMQKLLGEIAGPDRQKQSRLMEELIEKYAPEKAAAGRLASNERNAGAALMGIGTAQMLFRLGNSDGDGVPNYWVADISGLHRLRLKTGKAADYIEDGAARADARPAVALDAEGAPPKAEGVHLLKVGAAAPKAGYLFVALNAYEGADGKPAPYDSGNGRNPSRFGVCAYPVEYGKTGKMTFIKNEATKPAMWKKDTGGKPPAAFPLDPRKDGWQPYD